MQRGVSNCRWISLSPILTITNKHPLLRDCPVSLTMADKGKGKATQVSGSESPASAKATSPAPIAAGSTSTAGTAAATASSSASSGPPMHTKGDWSAVWNAE